MTHTPGPWFYGKSELDDNGITESISIGPYDVPQHYEDTICEVWDGEHHAKANAKLIAAAPDLLKALEDMVNPDTDMLKCIVRTKAAWDAINKARGIPS